MLSRRSLLMAAAPLALALGGVGLFHRPKAAMLAAGNFPVKHTAAEWRKLLTSHQYSILREAGTEYPFTSPLLDEHRHGIFQCAGCAHPLFSSETKYDSGTGWPSFWAPLKDSIGTERNDSFGFSRIAVHCATCGGHLGHVFEDGPKPTGLRYCMNGVALKFEPVGA
ncbi:MAG TPA: peptide-methionine (R)-S-oxide reductase MsrB [Stellaceae bacterium]|jgi:peptide-methionine (R)-S-oxide reductase|nr:peptide-methionine (R)-S-oxide reductase MsrB [Stellaceae bacterium]